MRGLSITIGIPLPYGMKIMSFFWDCSWPKKQMFSKSKLLASTAGITLYFPLIWNGSFRLADEIPRTGILVLVSTELPKSTCRPRETCMRMWGGCGLLGVVEALSSSRRTAGDSIIESRTHLYKRQRTENIQSCIFGVLRQSCIFGALEQSCIFVELRQSCLFGVLDRR